MLQALRNEIIVKPVYEEKRGQIIIPAYSPQFKQYHGSIYGIVISVGPKSEFRNEVKLGDKVIFQRYEGKVIQMNNEKYFVLRDRWIYGKIND